jgi:transcriptional regulator with XRE-family HTH domain
MKLNQAEIIQILRKRSGMNQGQFGAKVFNTSFQTGRTKIKNIELGKQAPTVEDLESMAHVLNLPVSQLTAGELSGFLSDSREPTHEASHPVLACYPGLDVYLDLLNKAAALDDVELIDHIAAKISELLSHRKSLTQAALK